MPVTSEQTVSTPTTGGEQLQSRSMHGKSTNESTASVVSVDGSSSNPTSLSMIQPVTQLLQAQRDMMAAQVKAMATNSVPPLKLFSEDDFHTKDGSIDQWLEQFEYRAQAAHWNNKQKFF